jgi:hypothetical protein
VLGAFVQLANTMDSTNNKDGSLFIYILQQMYSIRPPCSRKESRLRNKVGQNSNILYLAITFNQNLKTHNERINN